MVVSQRSREQQSHEEEEEAKRDLYSQRGVQVINPGRPAGSSGRVTLMRG